MYSGGKCRYLSTKIHRITSKKGAIWILKAVRNLIVAKCYVSFSVNSLFPRYIKPERNPQPFPQQYRPAIYWLQSAFEIRTMAFTTPAARKSSDSHVAILHNNWYWDRILHPQRYFGSTHHPFPVGSLDLLCETFFNPWSVRHKSLAKCHNILLIYAIY